VGGRCGERLVEARNTGVSGGSVGYFSRSLLLVPAAPEDEAASG
jgi:hypothetical protein